jgi:hypothetical protein
VTITYSSVHRKDTLVLAPRLPYLERLHAGGVITSVGGFLWDFPRVAVALVNNTPRTVVLNEGTVRIDSIEPITEGLLRLYSSLENNVGQFTLINDGWGELRDVQLSYAVQDLEHCNTPRLNHNVVQEQIGTLSERKEIDILPRVPPELRRESYVCAVGDTKYISNGQSDSLRFSIVVPLYRHIVQYMIVSPSYEYELFLERDHGHYSQSFPVNHVIKTGESDLFTIVIGTDRSATFHLHFYFRTLGGDVLDGGPAKLSIIVPRTAAVFVADSARVRASR